MRRRLTIAVACAVVTVAQARSTAKITGIGATSCVHFNEEVASRPAAQRDYFAWAQGLMSGVLLRAPEGVDEDLDLAPPNMPLNAQAEFVRKFCAANPTLDYLDAVRALYHRLRGPGS